MTLQRAAIVGLGLIGGSIGAALRSSGTRVLGFDASRRNAATALQRRLVDEVRDSLSALLAEVDVVVLAVPVGVVVDLLPVVDSLAAPQALILDTGSVKRRVVATMAALPGAERAVGGHPLAGKELSGPEAADPGLFRDRPFLLTPSARTGTLATAAAERMARDLGARPLTVTPEEHDRVLARTSHLPQLLSTTLALSTRPDDWKLSGAGLQDMTRLAGSDVTMWRDILMTNGDNVLHAARGYIHQLETLLTIVESGDPVRVEGFLAQGRSAWETLHAGAVV